MDSEFLVRAINSSPGIIMFSLDTNYCYTSFSKSHEDAMMLFLGVDIHIGQNILSILTTRDRVNAKDNLDRALRGEKFNLIEKWVNEKSETVYWEVRFNAIQEPDGSIQGVVIFMLDVTQQISIKNLLEETQTRLKLALKGSKTGVWEWDIKTNAVFWSDEVFEIFSVPDSEKPITYDRYVRSIHPDDRDYVLSAIQTTLENRSEYQIEHRVNTANQETRWIRAIGQVLTDNNDRPEKLIGTVHDITEQKNEHNQYKELALVANTTTNMVVITDREGFIEWVNPSFVEITGYTLAEVKGKKPGHVLQGPESDQKIIAFMRNNIKEGRGFKNVELINYTKAGKHYWVSIEVQPLKNDQDEVFKFVALQNDVTDQKIAREHLQESESRFRQMIQYSPMGVLMYELNKLNQLILIETNDSANRILGVDIYKFIGLPLEEIFPPLAKTEIPNHYRKAAREGVPWFGEDVVYSDEKIDGAYQVHAFQAGTNRVAVFFLDITERLKAQKELEEWQTRYELIVQSSGQMIYDYDISSGSIQWSGNTDQILGFTNEEMGDINQWSTLIHPDDRESILVELQYAQKKHSKFDVVYRFRTRQGDYKILSDRGFFFVDRTNPDQTRMLGVMEDITSKKEAEDSLMVKNNELLKANEELDRFVYSASHDLRAPIASLLGLIQVARLEKSRDALEMLFTLQEKSLKKLDTFIRDIVDHSRNARLPVEGKPVDVQKCINEAFEQFHFLENMDKIRKDIQIRQETIFITDPKRFQIIINNLISNAIKYADPSKPDPYLEISVDINSHRALFKFHDNGEGIMKELQDQIFDMFFRASSRGTGSGLGLYIVKEVVHKLNGEITVQSDYGKESTFTVLLPNNPNTI
jgi:PAS domain S-box-containing protein